LTLDTDNKCFRIAATTEQVRNAPGFDKDGWPSMADRSWADSIHRYYGRPPYWQRLERDDATYRDVPPAI
jgi:hypothetical protein